MTCAINSLFGTGLPPGETKSKTYLKTLLWGKFDPDKVRKTAHTCGDKHYHKLYLLFVLKKNLFVFSKETYLFFP